MAGYIHFTEEQKQRANTVDLVHFLQMQGETLIPSGRDKRLESDHSITVRGSRWYDHAAEKGGYAIDLVKRLYGLTFPEAVTMLLGGEQGIEYKQYQKQEPEQRKSFRLPEVNTDMRRAYAYLMKQRYIDRDVISEFAREQLIYEDKNYHNIVFVGMDENQVAHHAHKKSTLTIGDGYRGNVEGSNPSYSFHYISKNAYASKLFVFEAPIDMLSYISLNQKGWKNCHYVALNGVSEKPILKLLELYPNINHVVLGLDHDIAGIEADEKIYDLLTEKGAVAIGRVRPEYKDWNESLKANHGMTPIPAEEHPQISIRDRLCSEIYENVKLFLNFDITLEEMKEDFNRCRKYTMEGEFNRAKEYLKDLAAISLISAAREYVKAAESKDMSTIQVRLKNSFRAYQNRGKLDNKMSDISFCLKSLFLLEKKELGLGDKSRAEGFERLAGECLKAIILAEIMHLSQFQAAEVTQNETMALS